MTANISRTSIVNVKETQTATAAPAQGPSVTLRANVNQVGNQAIQANYHAKSEWRHDRTQTPQRRVVFLNKQGKEFTSVAKNSQHDMWFGIDESGFRKQNKRYVITIISVSVDPSLNGWQTDSCKTLEEAVAQVNRRIALCFSEKRNSDLVFGELKFKNIEKEAALPPKKEELHQAEPEEAVKKLREAAEEKLDEVVAEIIDESVEQIEEEFFPEEAQNKCLKEKVEHDPKQVKLVSKIAKTAFQKCEEVVSNHPYGQRVVEYGRQIDQRVTREIDTTIRNGRRQEVVGQTRIQKGKETHTQAKKIDKKIQQAVANSETQVNIRGKMVDIESAKQQADALMARSARLKERGKVIAANGASNARTGMVIGAVKHELKQQIDNLSDTAGGHAGTVIGDRMFDIVRSVANGETLDTSPQAIASATVDLGVDIAKNTASTVAKATAYKAASTAILDYAPRLVGKIPNLNVVTGAITVGNDLMTAYQMGDAGYAAERVCSFGLTTACDAGCMAVATAFIPIPVVGTAVGMFASKAVQSGVTFLFS